MHIELSDFRGEESHVRECHVAVRKGFGKQGFRVSPGLFLELIRNSSVKINKKYAEEVVKDVANRSLSPDEKELIELLKEKFGL